MAQRLPNEDPDVITVLFLGDPKCGKTTFLTRLRAGPDSGPIKLLRDIDQPFIFEVSVKNRPYRLEVYDTSSPENWRLLTPHLIIICYDISQRLSLINMQRLWIKEAKAAFQNRVDGLPIVILGLKRDLRSETDPNGVIYPQEGYQVAQAMRADRYVECSAETGELLGMAFHDICMTAAATRSGNGFGLDDQGCSVQ